MEKPGELGDKPMPEMRRIAAWEPIDLLALAFFLLIVVAPFTMTLLPARPARESHPRIQCTNHLKQIALALANYESTYGCLPPAYTVDAAGRPMHSWRMLIAPFMEAYPLYGACNFNVAWDHPANTTVVRTPIYAYVCPADRDLRADPTLTRYAMSQGPGAFFDPARGAATTIDAITDGTHHTISVVEAGRAVPWASPDAPALGQSWPPEGPHPGGFHALHADGTVRFWKSDTPPAAFRAALTIAGGEVIPADEP